MLSASDHDAGPAIGPKRAIENIIVPLSHRRPRRDLWRDVWDQGPLLLLRPGKVVHNEIGLHRPRRLSNHDSAGAVGSADAIVCGAASGVASFTRAGSPGGAATRCITRHAHIRSWARYDVIGPIRTREASVGKPNRREEECLFGGHELVGLRTSTLRYDRRCYARAHVAIDHRPQPVRKTPHAPIGAP